MFVVNTENNFEKRIINKNIIDGFKRYIGQISSCLGLCAILGKVHECDIKSSKLPTRRFIDL